MEKNLNQADLGALVGFSNNHISHVEIGQTKVSLPLLLKIATTLDKDIDFFLLDTPYTSRERLINAELAEKLNQCNATTLITISKIIDVLIEQQNILKFEQKEYYEYIFLRCRKIVIQDDFTTPLFYHNLQTL